MRKDDFMNENIMNICGIDCYEKDGTAYLRLETAARGLGFTRIASSGNEVVRWETVRKYLSDLGVPTSWHGEGDPTGKDGLPEFIPENIFYRLAMKAKNEASTDYLEHIYQVVIPQLLSRQGSMAEKGLCCFESEQFGNVRALTVNNEPWFVAADVCRALEHSNASMALERLDDDEKAKFNLGLPGGVTNCVNEPGLYTLVLGSRKPKAKAFKRWLTHEVIPSIRKNGSYSAKQGLPNMENLRALAGIIRAADIPLAAQKSSPATRAQQTKLLMDAYGLPCVPDYVQEDPWQSQQLKLEAAPQAILTEGSRITIGAGKISISVGP